MVPIIRPMTALGFTMSRFTSSARYWEQKDLDQASHVASAWRAGNTGR